MYRIKLKNQLHLEHVEREKLEEINQSKMQFFTNISHEIRTPLTMLMAPIERLIESNPNEYQKKNINYIFRNTKRLERIVNQLLELQKIENTQFKLKAREIDLVKFIREIISLFDETANDKKILLSFEPNCDELLVWIDPEKMDKVLFYRLYIGVHMCWLGCDVVHKASNIISRYKYRTMHIYIFFFYLFQFTF